MVKSVEAEKSAINQRFTRTVIDVSHYEAPIDFKKVVADGIVAVIAKATQGVTVVDSAYGHFKRDAARYKLLWGSYHFGTGDPVDLQVTHYLDITKPKEAELVCLDFEENPTGNTMTLDQAREFVSQFQGKTGRYPALYSGHWLKERLNGKADDLLSKCPLWIAQYGPKALLPPGWKKYTLWQYTDGTVGPEPHTVAGIGPCDRNQFNGTITQLRKSWPLTEMMPA